MPALLLRLALRCHWHFAKKHTHAWPFPLALTLHLSLDNVVLKGNNIDGMAMGFVGMPEDEDVLEVIEKAIRKAKGVES